MVRSPAEDTGRVGESSASSGVEERSGGGSREWTESGQRDANGAACFRSRAAPAMVAGFPHCSCASWQVR